VREIGCRDPWAVILDDDFAVADANANRSTGWTPRRGVVKEIPDGALEGLRVSDDDCRLALELERDIAAQTPGTLDDRRHQLVERNRLANRLPTVGARKLDG
jgi:hypothetical protein